MFFELFFFYKNVTSHFIKKKLFQNKLKTLKKDLKLFLFQMFYDMSCIESKKKY